MSLASVARTTLLPFLSGIAPPVVQPQSFRVALRAKILSLQDVTDFVADHIYPGLMPPSHDLDRMGPAILYAAQKIPRQLLSGTGHVLSGSDGTSLVNVILTVCGLDFSQVDALATLLQRHLDGIHNATDWGNGSIVIMSCLFYQEVDASLPMSNARPDTVYQLECSFWVRYRLNPLPDNS